MTSGRVLCIPAVSVFRQPPNPLKPRYQSVMTWDAHFAPLSPAAAPPAVVALGGNALIRPGEEGSAAEQWVRVRELAPALARLAARGPLVLTHGNGPQVGRLLLRSDLCADQVPPEPLELAVAATQGEVGLMLQQCLGPLCARPVVTVLTQVRVRPEDPAFGAPSKPIGRYFTAAEARRLAAEHGWVVHEDVGRGWRRVVASPEPVEVIELPAIRALLAAGCVVIACGGGGVPVIPAHGTLAPVEAVVDKDLSTALLARALGAERLWILTGVDEVLVDFGTPDARPLRELRAAEAAALLAQGQFPEGSMGPKVRAALRFLEGGQGEVGISSPEQLDALAAGRRGTRIRP